MELIVDNREGKLKDLMNPELNIRFDNLEIGDFIFQKKDTNEILFIIERKTLPDLASSIKSGRYREQKLRLINSGISLDKIIYLIEGRINKTQYVDGMPSTTLISSIINLLLRDNIKTICTNDLEDTFYWLETIYGKIEDNKLKGGESVNNQDIQYLDTIKTKKKDNLNPKNCFILQLSIIPGVSNKIATTITENYPSLTDLLNGFNQLETKKELLLSDLTYQISNNKTRRIGKIISTRIYQYLFQITSDESK